MPDAFVWFFTQICTIFDHIRPSHIIFEFVGPIWTYFNPFGHVWSCLDLYWPIWTSSLSLHQYRNILHRKEIHKFQTLAHYLGCRRRTRQPTNNSWKSYQSWPKTQLNKSDPRLSPSTYPCRPHWPASAVPSWPQATSPQAAASHLLSEISPTDTPSPLNYSI